MKALEKDIQEALRKSAIVKKSRTKSLYGDLRVTLDRTIRLKNKARRLAREYPTEAYKNRAKELQKAVRWRLKDHMGEKWDRETEELDPRRTAFWNLQRAFRKRK